MVWERHPKSTGFGTQKSGKNVILDIDFGLQEQRKILILVLKTLGIRYKRLIFEVEKYLIKKLFSVHWRDVVTRFRQKQSGNHQLSLWMVGAVAICRANHYTISIVIPLRQHDGPHLSQASIGKQGWTCASFATDQLCCVLRFVLVKTRWRRNSSQCAIFLARNSGDRCGRWKPCDVLDPVSGHHY